VNARIARIGKSRLGVDVFGALSCYTSETVGGRDYPLAVCRNSVIKGYFTMQLTVYIDEVSKTLELPDDLLQEGRDFFDKMDRDMDQGWQMSRTWVDNPNREERCQIAASKMLDAISTENQTLLMLMAGYIKSRAPEVVGIRIDTAGDMTETELFADGGG
jgi:hypothetical protein